MKKILPLLLFVTSLANAQPLSWTPKGVGGGGALFSPSINPANNNEFFIACDMSELFHSADYGKNYSQVNFTQLQGGHNSRVAYTASGTLYCINYDDDLPQPVKSTDGGQTWALLSGNPDPTEETFSVHADFNNANRVLISYYGGIYFSSNGGNSFTQIHTAQTGAGNVVAGVFFDGNTIYIGTNDGLLISTNGGTSFTLSTIPGLGANEVIWSFCAAKSGATTRFFCLTGDAADVYVGLVGSDYWGFMAGVYTCDYGSTNWSACMTGITTGTDYPMFVDMAENDINTVYLAGSNSNAEPIVMKSTNAGASWSHTFITSSNQNIVTGWSGDGGDRGWSYGECPFGFDVSASNANYVMFGDFGFAHTTSDGGVSWRQAYMDSSYEHLAGNNTPVKQPCKSIGIENTTCWQVMWADANNMWACFSDIRGIRSTDAGSTWSFNYNGNTANSTYRCVKAGNGTLFAATSNVHDMYQSTRLQDNPLDNADAQGKLIYSTDNGLNWNLLHNFGHPVFWIAIDPNNPNRAYASVIHYSGGSGVGGIYRCDDLNNLGSSTWTLLSNPPRTQKHPASIEVLNDGNVVCTYSGRRNSGGTFQNCSGTFMYDPISGNWTDVSDPGMYYWTKDVVIDPNDATQNTWYVCVFSGWGGAPNGLGGLYKTTNRGAAWTKINNLDRVTSITFNPNNANEIFLTTETDGLWMSSNINATTPAFSLVTSYPFRQPERVFFNPYNSSEMWVTSFGNGMKMGTLTTTGIQFTNENQELSLFPNPAKEEIILNLQNAGETVLVEIFDAAGRLVQNEKISALNNYKLSVSSLQKGLYFLKVVCGTNTLTKRFVKE